jgi:hypothetical protein
MRACVRYVAFRACQFGYDILNFGENLECKALGLALFPSCVDDPTCINTEFVKLQHDYVEVLTKNYTQHTALNVLGTLQYAGGDSKVRGASALVGLTHSLTDSRTRELTDSLTDPLTD